MERLQAAMDKARSQRGQTSTTSSERVPVTGQAEAKPKKGSVPHREEWHLLQEFTADQKLLHRSRVTTLEGVLTAHLSIFCVQKCYNRHAKMTGSALQLFRHIVAVENPLQQQTWHLVYLGKATFVA